MLKTTVKINGMACSMCEAHVQDVIRKAVPKAKKVKASYNSGTASFISEEVDQEKLKDAITDIGYTFVSSESEPYEKKGLFLW